jgi:hypothetical protein
MKISPGSAALGDFGGLRVATFAFSGAASGRATTATAGLEFCNKLHVPHTVCLDNPQ